MRAALKVLSGPLLQRVLLLPSEGSGSTLLGRSLEANLLLSGPAVADRHALLLAEAGGHRLVPLTSQKPTWVGEERLVEARVLQEGDRIRIGNHLLVYHGRYRRGPIADPSSGWGGQAAGKGAEASTPCSSCGEPLGPGSGSTSSLSALWLSNEVFCPRCVDQRLHTDRSLESYRILRKVGTNKEEVTYLAVDKETNKRVAIRILRAEREASAPVFRRFLMRALVGILLDHPNYLGVEGIRAARGVTFVVLNYLETSANLEVLVREAAPLTPPAALCVTNQLAEILRYARERQLVVAKRKKSGLLVSRSLWVKVLAFDITLKLEEQVAATRAYQALAERYRLSAPEPRQEGSSSRSERLSQLANEFSEVYSVGRILYQLLSGKPFGPGSIDLVRAARDGAPRGHPLGGLPAPALEVLERVLVPSGAERLRTLEAYMLASKAGVKALIMPRGPLEPRGPASGP